MAEDQDKKNEDKFEFTPEGEVLGYISLDQAQVLAMRTARQAPGVYGPAYRDIPMAFEVVEDEDTEDHYVITLSFRPQGQFIGTPGQEQFFIEKDGTIAHRQVLSLPLPAGERRFPVVPVSIGLVAVLIASAVGVVFAVRGGGGDDEGTPVATSIPTRLPLPTATSVPQAVVVPTRVPTPTKNPTNTRKTEILFDSVPEGALVYVLPGSLDDYSGFEDLTQERYFAGPTPLTTELGASDALVAVAISIDQMESQGFEVPLILLSSGRSYGDVFEFDGNISMVFAYQGVSPKPVSVAKIYVLKDVRNAGALISVIIPASEVDNPIPGRIPPYLYPTFETVQVLPDKYIFKPEDVLRAMVTHMQQIGSQEVVEIELLNEARNVLSKVGKVQLVVSGGRIIVQMRDKDRFDFTIFTTTY